MSLVLESKGNNKHKHQYASNNTQASSYPAVEKTSGSNTNSFLMENCGVSTRKEVPPDVACIILSKEEITKLNTSLSL